MSLYLKYRPKTIEELDLANVREGLSKIFVQNKVAHAYLFTGPRGAGKTSSARILARIVNCEKNEKKLSEPCNECENCKSILNGSATDVVEIDAASNRGIDDVRELKEKIRLAPSNLRKKVYIIDEVHMMTTEAFNALLKTLEEPPEHALFILATTEAHKVPETIVSRCQRVLFSKASDQEVKRSLMRVIKGEGIKITNEAVNKLSGAVDGSFRDAVKTLDQLVGGDKEIGPEEVEEIISGVSGQSLQKLVEGLSNRELESSLVEYRELVKQGMDLVYLAVETIKGLRELVVGEGRGELIPLIYQLDETACKLASSPVPEILIEMVIIEWCGARGTGTKKARSQSVDKGVVTSPKAVKREAEDKKSNKPQVKERVEGEEEDEEIGGKEPQGVAGGSVNKSIEYKGSIEELWRKLKESLRGGSYSLGALISKANPVRLEGNELVIGVKYEFHREQVMAERHRSEIESLLSKITGTGMILGCEIGKVKQTKQKGEELQEQEEVDNIAQAEPEEHNSQEDDGLLEAAENIFGA